MHEEGIEDFLRENSRAQFYDNKLKTLDYFLNVMLPGYLAFAVPILNKNYTALEISL